MIGDQYDEWKELMQILLRQDGVVYKGMVNHHEMSMAYKKAGFILYPTTFPETGCLAIMKVNRSLIIFRHIYDKKGNIW